MIGAWAEVLHHIPPDMLDECYLEASRSKHNGFAVNALDIIAAYNVKQQAARMEAIFGPLDR